MRAKSIWSVTIFSKAEFYNVFQKLYLSLCSFLTDSTYHHNYCKQQFSLRFAISSFWTCPYWCFFSCLKVTKVGLKVLKVPLSPPSPPPPSSSSVKCKILPESGAMHWEATPLSAAKNNLNFWQFAQIEVLQSEFRWSGVIQCHQSSFNFWQFSFHRLKFYNSADDLFSCWLYTTL